MIETERKFLAKINRLRLAPLADEINLIEQGYLASNRWFEIRLRQMSGLNQKAKQVHGASPHWRLALKLGNGERRIELEGDINSHLAETLWLMFRPPYVKKIRMSMPSGWEIDVFLDKLKGLVLAERERDSAGEIMTPRDGGLVLCEEVTADRSYANKSLAKLSYVSARQIVIRADDIYGKACE